MNNITSALYEAVPFYIAVIPFTILNLYIIKKKRELLNVEYRITEKIFTLGFILSLMFILSITIGNNPPLKFQNVTWQNISVRPFEGVYMQYVLGVNGNIYSIINLFGNILIFAPWGFFLAAYYKENKNEKFKILLIAFLTSFSIETIQLFSGRSADITDIILNTIGVLLGRFVFCYLNIIFNEFFNNMHIRYPNNNNNKVKVFTVVQVISCLIFLVASQS
ncbi:VanZ family protein [Ruminiclostridium cellulolyticum]|uniref:VanZ family protein n=1 Tax=Ruminiclostridium cellulolyticum (strain ATCC 35319 / DSM 5812 / JCM 6584 / H10) TaxID=394503 RepID=B8I707_RUMCH|nr:VanZ family protein [Ruminiclostridium cellulolyticum]ACL76999.1 VanZ family protein [Ruminiclostridium cellulolyticum H10]